MKYWRGYLIALIAAACSWALVNFAKGHTLLVDMVYPYASRLIQTYLAAWSAPASFCVWQAVLVGLIALGLASVVLMILLKWNPIQWFGWITAVVSLLSLLNTAVYGLNDYASDLSEDIRLEVNNYSFSELETATKFFRDRANDLASQVKRDSEGNVLVDSFQDMAEDAADGFKTLTYEESMPVFAGSTIPVKELGWSNRYTRKGVTGVTVGLTGEAAVNPQTPGAALPFAICREMARRMSISIDRDADFAAFLTCNANESEAYQYAANMMAYRYCYNAMVSLDTANARSAAARLSGGANRKLTQDLETLDAFLKDNRIGPSDAEVCDLLVSWHIQNYVLPLQVEEAPDFDPQDETQVDLSGIVNAKPAQ